ncbi:unnamed protein product [Nezara viridula]|uniref:Uncharacterized protein n=1 Tax=Nezara viridula TaxID=85310 RepID=A0A9P0HBE9_NEZVI|nr:unnamed protein product [Nezara viridula]
MILFVRSIEVVRMILFVRSIEVRGIDYFSKEFGL